MYKIFFEYYLLYGIQNNFNSEIWHTWNFLLHNVRGNVQVKQWKALALY